jgi:hypothetical protein
VLARDFSGRFGAAEAARTFERWMLDADTDHVLALDERERRRIFNLGYFTWVEQQGVSVEEFEARRQPAFWERVRAEATTWDEHIDELNARTGVLESL